MWWGGDARPTLFSKEKWMTEAELRAQIEAEVRAQIEAEQQGKARLDGSLQQLRASASQAANTKAVREDYGLPPSENARTYGAVLAAQMLMGIPGTGLADDGLGDGSGE